MRIIAQAENAVFRALDTDFFIAMLRGEGNHAHMRLSILLLALSVSLFSAEDANVVKIYSFAGDAKKGHCATAFFVSPVRLITAAHTFSFGGTNHYIKVAGDSIPVTIVRIDYEKDICLVEAIHYENKTWYTLQRNGVVLLKGFRKEERVQSDEGVSRGERLYTDNQIIEGESGGPLVNETGQVIGMGIAGHGKHECVSVSSDTICKFLDSIAAPVTAPVRANH